MRCTVTTTAIVSILFFGGTGMLAGCQSNAKGESEAMCTKRKPGTIVTVNEYCAVNLADPVDPAIVETWKGQKVGFCCKGCLPKWAKMTDAQKDTALAQAVARGKVKD